MSDYVLNDEECPWCGATLVEDERGNLYCPESHRISVAGKEEKNEE